jgi:hypothetical protein
VRSYFHVGFDVFDVRVFHERVELRNPPSVKMAADDKTAPNQLRGTNAAFLQFFHTPIVLGFLLKSDHFAYRIAGWGRERTADKQSFQFSQEANLLQLLPGYLTAALCRLRSKAIHFSVWMRTHAGMGSSRSSAHNLVRGRKSIV